MFEKSIINPINWQNWTRNVHPIPCNRSVERNKDREISKWWSYKAKDVHDNFTRVCAILFTISTSPYRWIHSDYRFSQPENYAVDSPWRATEWERGREKVMKSNRVFMRKRERLINTTSRNFAYKIKLQSASN